MGKIPEEVFDLIRQLDLLLTKIEAEGRNPASLNAVTLIGEQLCNIGGVDLLSVVDELVMTFDEDHPEDRTHLLGLCWDGICDKYESFVGVFERFGDGQ